MAWYHQVQDPEGMCCIEPAWSMIYAALIMHCEYKCDSPYGSLVSWYSYEDAEGYISSWVTGRA